MESTCRAAAFDGVEVTPNGFAALTTSPWLEIQDLDIAALAGRFVEIVMRASLLDQPARPVIRFVIGDGRHVDRIGSAPIFGATIWVGRVPATARQLLISPTDQLGSFGFRVERIRTRSWPSLLAEGIRRRPKQTRSSVLTRLIGWRPESDNNLNWAIGAHDLDSSDAWRAARTRELDLADLDRPRFDWLAAPPIHVIVRTGSDAAALASTLASLREQAFTRWKALVLGDQDSGAAAPSGTAADPRIRSISMQEVSDDLATADPDMIFVAVDAGDQLPPYALAFLAEQRRRSPSASVFFGDELVAGRLVLKPGWSPRLQAARPFIGRAVFVRGTSSWSGGEIEAYIRHGTVPLPNHGGLRTARVAALRRVLLASPDRPHDAGESDRRDAPTGLARRAAVIILTADHPALLRRAVASVRAKSPAGTRILIVDNSRGGAEHQPATESLAEDDCVTVLRRPGPFNYSALCNEAAALADADLLVFLNDDTEVLSQGWIERFTVLAFQPHVGAIGAKLTFPDGRLQHVGVLVGMGESAGHLGALTSEDDPGWWGRNLVVHEVSAATGACLAVAREKFVAVGGFDAVDLPVELSDIDLCLKLNARGWQTLVEPHVHLMHEESASRGGATFRRLTVYDAQRQVFLERWRHILRDDPFFHPALSLYSVPVALG